MYGSDSLLATFGLDVISALAIAGCTLAFVAYLIRFFNQPSDTATETKGDPYNDIVPLKDFDYAKTKPIAIRPFKPKYHLSMALENITFSDLIEMDDTYLDRITRRRKLMDQHPSETFGLLPGADDAIAELYTWVFGTYLPKRFPRHFILIAPPSGDDANPKAGWQVYCRNKITSESVPVTAPKDPLAALRLVSSHVDTDLFILDDTPPDDDDAAVQPHEFDAPPGAASANYLRAFVTCFPNGAAAPALGKPVSAIHGPVPRYAAKLERSMDRFFATLPLGKAVKRANWTVTDWADGGGDGLFRVATNHIHAGDGAGAEEEVRRARDEVRIEDCVLRCERQTLHHLPGSGALVFGFKTYTYELAEVRGEEGMAEALAEAVEGMDKGSVPEMGVYKRGVVWGPKVVEFMRAGKGA